MELIERAKNILLTPKTEWLKIEQENDSHIIVLTKYLLILAIIPAICSFIGYGLIGYTVWGAKIASISLGIRYAIIHYVTCVGGAYLTAFILDILSDSFKAEKGFDKKFQLVAYCYTATCIGGIFYIYSGLSILASLASLYSLYLLYLGLKPMTNVPEENKITYFIIALLCMIVIFFLLSFILSTLFISSLLMF